MIKHPGQVALVFVHYPLPSHRFAIPAARAVECAAAQGRAPQLIGALYAKQDSIGMKSWASYGSEAGLADTAGLSRCASGSSVPKRIDSGHDLGVKLKVTGTPTVLVNGWRYGRAPDNAELEQIIQNVLSRGSPVDSTQHASR
jgi:protein-disulfide isomerase